MQDVQRVLAAYADRLWPSELEDLAGAGGFSGARFWRLKTAAGTLCLRRWPAEHPSSSRLAMIHAVLQHVAEVGVHTIPVPFPTCDSGASFVEHAGFLWELTPWMPGRADYHQAPSRNRLAAALEALGQFHQAAADFSGNRPALTVAPAIQPRRKLLNDLLRDGLRQLQSVLDTQPKSEILEIAKRITALFPCVAGQIERQLSVAEQLSVPTQPCIRDIWHDHVLFTDDRVTGLIDFGALKLDSVSTDLSRLLGSLAGDDPEEWACGIAAYQRTCRLAAEEFRLIGVLDSSTILLSGMNWLRWIYLENRTFEDLADVTVRLRGIAARLERLVSRAGQSVLDLADTKAPPPLIMP
jgi:homoserine kinase type II